jgi:ribosomal protein L29
MDYQEITIKGQAELTTFLAEQREKLRTLRWQASERQLKNVKAINGVKKTIARILTRLNVIHKEAKKV